MLIFITGFCYIVKEMSVSAYISAACIPTHDAALGEIGRFAIFIQVYLRAA
jgi:hypothetical protein